MVSRTMCDPSWSALSTGHLVTPTFGKHVGGANVSDWSAPILPRLTEYTPGVEMIRISSSVLLNKSMRGLDTWPPNLPVALPAPSRLSAGHAAGPLRLISASLAVHRPGTLVS